MSSSSCALMGRGARDGPLRLLRRRDTGLIEGGVAFDEVAGRLRPAGSMRPFRERAQGEFSRFGEAGACRGRRGRRQCRRMMGGARGTRFRRTSSRCRIAGPAKYVTRTFRRRGGLRRRAIRRGWRATGGVGF